jgi:hypothetical protein
MIVNVNKEEELKSELLLLHPHIFCRISIYVLLPDAVIHFTKNIGNSSFSSQNKEYQIIQNAIIIKNIQESSLYIVLTKLNISSNSTNCFQFKDGNTSDKVSNILLPCLSVG